MGGQLVQFMEVSFQKVGIYSSREMAIYSDSRSQTGEQISKVEVYFYSLDLDGERHIRRMVKLSRLGEKRPIRHIIGVDYEKD